MMPLNRLEMFGNAPSDRWKYPRRKKVSSYLVSSRSPVTLSKPRTRYFARKGQMTRRKVIPVPHFKIMTLKPCNLKRKQ